MSAPRPQSKKELLKLSLAALGIVYGDIGTSPLYAIKECFGGEHAMAPSSANVLGVLSLVTWALILVVVVKYLVFIMRADNRGEGGILALLALLLPRRGEPRGRTTVALVMAGLFGAALLYGDGIITPSLSVLSAVEGLSVATDAFTPFVVPITMAILVTLFAFQRHGTARVGSVFGPAMILWFGSLAALGLPQIIAHPEVLAAFNPLHGIALLAAYKLKGFLLLGAVVLVVTGGEALYADLGHFGKGPIRLAWFAVAMPGLLINYYGQGALVLARGAEVLKNPFYALAPSWFLYPLVVIATLATVIASQALISGAFSLTRQAVQLGYWPRVTVKHTSGESEGQIYIPEINWMLMVSCLALVLGFRESGKLAAAYGIAVTGTMSITSILFYAVARSRWKWPRWQAGLLVAGFLVVDLAFFSANLDKIPEGGWFPLVIGAVVFAVMTTWQRGRAELAAYFRQNSLPIELFLADIAATRPQRVDGTAVFMTSTTSGAPQVLLHHFKHNKVLHRQVVLLSVVTEEVPAVPEEERAEVTELGEGFFRVIAHYGFMQTPDVLQLFRRCRLAGLLIVPEETSFYLGRESLLLTGRTRLFRWRKWLFSYLSRNARPATAFFHLPPNRVVELGAQIEL
jgi:KUP system potassium uptake protein